ncbi:MAG: hypothetical protein LBP72_03995 [Dysgonamonadaceae bacterium]|jgi:hypothetical protein|nr:hypothetical protein [Dysgonamonadaceae bacterium]
MKYINYLFATILLLFVSCNDEHTDKNNLPSTLNFKAVIPNDLRSSSISESEQKLETDTILLFSGKDIAWYNETTRELKFKDHFPGIEIKGYASVDLLIYSGDESLFSINLILTSNYMSWVINSPVLLCGTDGKTYYVKDGYPDWEWLSNEEPVQIERNENWKAIESGWNIFIEQLKKEGRYRK